jgi:hypothetical protein
MTLILSLITPHYAIQMSDRMVTWLEDAPGHKRGDCKEDDRIKMVLYRNEMVFSFTGTAELECKRTDIWLLEELARNAAVPLNVACDRVARRAGEALRGLRHPLAFVGVGFTPVNPLWVPPVQVHWAGCPLPEIPVRPVIIRISNRYDENDTLLDSPRDEFLIHHNTCPDRQLLYCDDGCYLNGAEAIWLNRRMANIGRRGSVPGPVVRSFTELIRRVSKRFGGMYVGKSLLGVFLPRAAATHSYRQEMLVHGEPGFDFSILYPSKYSRSPQDVSPMFFAISENSKNGTAYAPHLVLPNVAVRDFKMELLPPE